MVKSLKKQQLLSIFTFFFGLACWIGAAAPETRSVRALKFTSDVADSGDIMGYVSTLRGSYRKC